MSKMGEFHFEELQQHQEKLKKLVREFPGFIEECVRELAARLLAKTIARTPVGVYGEKEVSFTTAQGKVVNFKANIRKVGGTLRDGWTVGPIQRVGNEYLVEIINPVEYAMYVEFGHRTRDHTGWVDGRFMLTISEEELEREMPAFLDRKLQQFMNRLEG